jgi:hypothetical protein
VSTAIEEEELTDGHCRKLSHLDPGKRVQCHKFTPPPVISLPILSLEDFRVSIQYFAYSPGHVSWPVGFL